MYRGSSHTPKLRDSEDSYQMTEDGPDVPSGQGFEDLEVFRRAYRVSLDVHRVSLDFPTIEQGALADQIRRASKSICANLAEGFARQGESPADFRRYIQIAMGSSDEMRVWSRYCLDLGYIGEDRWRHWRDEYQGISRMLWALRKAVGHRI
jgi:four helix bundle protein